MLIKSHYAPQAALDLLSPPYANINFVFRLSPWLSGVTQQCLRIMLSLVALTFIGLVLGAFYYFRGGSNRVSDL